MTIASRSFASLEVISSRCVRWGVVFALAACGSGKESSADSAVTSAAAASRTDSAPASATTPVTSAKPTCVSEGDWQQCSVAKRLTDAGYVPIEKGAAPAGIFPVPGMTYALGRAEVHVYVFKSAKERAGAVSAIDTVAVAPKGKVPSWTMPATLITSNNVAAILVSDNDAQVERVHNAIIAGLPRASTPPTP